MNDGPAKSESRGRGRGVGFWRDYITKKVVAGESLTGLQVDGVDLSKLSIAGAKLNGSQFRNCRLEDARLRGADLENADLRDCNLRGVNLRGANLKNCRFDKADLTEANLDGADVEGAKFFRSNLQGASLVDCNLRKASFLGANLFDANLQNSELRSADLREANLECANLTGANLYRANFAAITFNALTQVQGVRNAMMALRIPTEMLDIIESAGKAETAVAKVDTTADFLRSRSAADLRSGDIMGNKHQFEIMRKIGRGGCSTVYLARDLVDLKIPFKAIKILDNKLRADAVQVERFKREGLIGRKLSHKNVVKVYDMVHAKEFDTYYMVMNYVDGIDLGKMLRRQREKKERFNVSLGIKILYQVCMGLDFIHNEGIVHRDMKPGNILLRRQGGVVITDFGLSRLVQDMRDGSGLTAPGTVLGTFAYMAPEQLMDAEVDGRADVYSLGVIMYEMFTGKRPFAATSILGWANAIRSQVPERPSLYVQDFSKPLEKMILKCLEKEPENRYPTARQLAEELRSVVPQGSG